MTLSKLKLGMLIVAAGVGVTACGTTDLTPFFGALFARQINGTVTDDARLLPSGPDSVPTPLAGARVEVVDGPEKGRFAISAANGQFDLGVISAGSLLRATLTGWEFAEYHMYAQGYSTIGFALGRAPHVLWGRVGRVNAGARVEILTGSNAGKVALTGETGQFRLDDLATSGSFELEFSKAGYRTDRLLLSELRRNHEVAFSLTPISAPTP